MFTIVPIADDAPILLEQLGTKRKFWLDQYRFLFKEARPNTGEDWAEKVAAELCEKLSLPHATYELATWKEKRGVVTENFAQREDGRRLILGNELLFKLDPRYPEKEKRGVRQHTVRKALAVTSLEIVKPPLGFNPTPGIETAADVFVGYLMFDAWIANQDRHHENWGLVLLTREKTVHLAPSFDHASSMGPFETDAARSERLKTMDKMYGMSAYVEKARSAFYGQEVSDKPLFTIDTFLAAARLRPKAGLAWLKRLESVPMSEAESIFDMVPEGRMSRISKEFSKTILSLNKNRLLGCVGALLR
jgi:hypothetical protein